MGYFRTFLQSPEENTVLLIDGDLYAYRACAAAEEEIDWGDDIWSLATDLKQAKEIFTETISGICDALEAKAFIICLSDKDNFRKTIDSEYKGGRKKVRKPVGYPEMLKYLGETFHCFKEPLLEADDLLGILGSAPGHNTIMVSDDKDLKCVPGKLYRPMSGEFLTISQADADRWFYTQTLTGDAVDGYSGCPTVGIKTAEKLLARSCSWDTVVQAYAKQKLDANYAITQARLARILRYEDWDTKKNTIKLWTPKTSHRGKASA